MLANIRNKKFCEAIIVAFAVISLAISAGAATIPSVSTLAPIENSLQTPLRMALAQNGDLYVADPRSGGIVVLDQYGVAVKTIPLSKAVNAVALLNPLVSNIPGGSILVAHSNQVVVLNESGVEVAKLGSGEGQFVRAAGIAVDETGKIFVADSGSYNVKCFDTAGNYTSAFGAYGAPPTTGVFKQPTAISIFRNAGVQQLAVVDTVNGNVQFFTTSGAYIKTVGASGAASPLLFTYPVGVAFEHTAGTATRMYVLDSYQGNVQVVDVSVAPPVFLSYIGSYGFVAGRMTTPSDLVYDQVNSRLLVSNGMSNVLSFGIDGGANPFNSLPPSMTVAQSAISVDVNSVNITGTVDAGCALNASASTSALISAAAFPSVSSWTIAVSNLVPGLNLISVTAKNQYGATVTKTVSVNYQPPALQLTVNPFPALTGQAAMTLTGTAEPGSVVTVTNAATSISGQASLIDNVWIYVVSLVEGSNAVSITADKSGASSSRKDVSLTLDTLPPVIRASLLSDGSSTANQVLSISGTVYDQSAITMSVNGNPVVPVNGLFNTAIPLNLGTNTITVAASDELGNLSSFARTVIFDPALMKISVSSPADGSYTNIGETVVMLDAADASSVSVNGVPALSSDSAGKWSSSVNLVAGINTIVVEATDAFGRTVQEKRTVYFDNVAPVINIVTPVLDVAIRNPGFMVKGNITESSGIKNIRATINNADAQLTLADGEFSVFAEFSKEGTYSVVVTVTDVANNTSTAQRTIIYDVTPPAITVNPALAFAPTSLEGTVEPGANVVVADAAGVFAPVVLNGSNWRADLSAGNFDYATLAVTATDAAGNASVKSINVPIPDGDVDGDGQVTVSDALRVIKIVVNNIQPTSFELQHGDVGPLFKGKRNPNGTLDLDDCVLILRKALGLESWLD